MRRVGHALVSTGWSSLWDSIIECNVDNRCGSIYCERCRFFYSCWSNGRLKKLFSIKYNNDDVEARKELRYLTVLTHVVELDLSSVDQAIEIDKVSIKALKRRFPDIIIEGRHEIEMIDVRNIFLRKECPRKVEAIYDLTEGKGPYIDNDMVLVHFHAVVSLGGHNKKEVAAWMRERWPGRHHVHMKGLYKENDVKVNLSNIASYNLKNVHVYNMFIEGNKKRSDLYMSMKSLSFRIMCDMKIGNWRMTIKTNGWMK
jgi:hypothetical protein